MCLRASALTSALLVILCARAGTVAPGRALATETEFCLSVRNLVEMRTPGFSAVRGAADGPPSEDGFQFYDSLVNLGGADICKVWFDEQDGGWGYECSWHAADPAAAERQFTTLTQGLSSCYPRARTERPWARRFSIDSPRIKVRFREAGTLSGVVLTIE